MSDPKKGTGKHPGKKHGRRLYTDENPRDTVGIKFATPTDARKTVAKVKKINKPFARKIQILTVGEQRAKVMGKSKVAALISKIQKNLKDSYQSIGDAMIGGGIDNMDKYKYLLGQAHAYYKISQDISNLLKKKEPNNGKQDKENIIRFDATKN